MKIGGLNSLLLRTLISCSTSTCEKNARSSMLLYSTAATRSVVRDGENDQPHMGLYHRISRVGNYNVSIQPILDQWIEEGVTYNRDSLLYVIKELRRCGRHSHALQMSIWMDEKRKFKLTSQDVAIRLDLITKVHGIEQAEKFLNSIPEQLRAHDVYSSLLSCYVYAKSVEKAEELFQKLKVLVKRVSPVSYNVMLNLYHYTGDMEKLRNLLREMEEEAVPYDSFTYGIILGAYAAASDVEGLEKTVRKMESDPHVVLDWVTYAAAAKGYTKVGLVEKALAMLNKSEILVTGRRRKEAYNCLLTQYAAIEKKDEVLRIWEIYRKKEKLFNMGYISILSSLLKFDDLENSEKIFDEWQSWGLYYDIRIPNLLLRAYVKTGLMEKAENLINRVTSKGGIPNFTTCNLMVGGYMQSGQILNAIKEIKQAISGFDSKWKPRSKDLAFCLNYLTEQNPEKADNLIQFLTDNNIITSGGQLRLVRHLKLESSDLSETQSIIDDSLVHKVTQNYENDDESATPSDLKTMRIVTSED